MSGEFWAQMPEDQRLKVAAIGVAGAGASVGELVYHFSGINGDAAGIVDGLNPRIDAAKSDMTTARTELTTLQADDKVYTTNGDPVPAAQKAMEGFEAGRIKHDNTTVTTLTKELPNVPLPEHVSDLSGAGTALVLGFVWAGICARRGRPLFYRG